MVWIKPCRHLARCVRKPLRATSRFIATLLQRIRNFTMSESHSTIRFPVGVQNSDDRTDTFAPVCDVSWQRFSVPFEYPVCFTDGLFKNHNTTLVETLCRLEPQKRHRIVVFIDDGVAAHCPQLLTDLTEYASFYSDHIELAADPVLLPGGEEIKSDDRYIEQMQQLVAECHIDRHSYVIGVGGGALLDAAGLVAATSHRGIRHIRVPTTVLAQNDSGVGVKNGVNLFGQKNYLGSFAPPFAVLNDYDFIRSLPDRDKIAGMAEAVKVALIRDLNFYQWLEQNADSLAVFNEDAMRYMIKRCAELHMHQIAQGGDPFETGSARPLDYGHWAAHKIETLSDYQLRHGEAVAIGLALDSRYSVVSGLLASGEEDRVCFLLEHLGFKLWHDTLDVTDTRGLPKVLEGVTEFREHLGGALTITLLEALGQGIEVHEMDDAVVAMCIQWMKERCHD